MVNRLISLNEKYIKLYEEDKLKLDKYLAINDILKEENCFMKINIEYAYSILRDLGIPEEEIRNIYLQLITLN